MVAISAAIAELAALQLTVAEFIWLINTLEELGFPRKCVVFCDNEGALKTVRDPALLESTKYVRKTAHFVKQYYELRMFDLLYVSTKDNIADMLTKPPGEPIFSKLCRSEI